MRAFRAAPSWLIVLAALAVLSTLGMILLIAVYPEPTGVVNVLVNTLDDVAIVFAFAAALVAFRTSVGSERTMWGYLALGFSAWLLAELIADIQDLAFDGTGSVSVADLFYLLYYPCAIAALRARDRDRSSTGFSIGLLDTMIVASAAALLMWQAVVRGTLGGSDATLTTIVDLAYPAFDVAVIWMLVRPLYERGTIWSESRVFLALGLVGIFAANVLWLSLHFDLYALIVTPSMILIGIAALLHPHAGEDVEPAEDHKRRIIEAVLLISSTAVVVGLLFFPDNSDNLTLLIGGTIVIAMLLARALFTTFQNEQLLSDAEHRAGTDSLTGLLNHQRFEERCNEEIALAARRDEPLALLMIDIDNFKAVNDIGGHLVGDRVLREIATRIRAACRLTDAVCRIGGDEMAIIAPDTDARQALDLAERVRSSVGEVVVGELEGGVNAHVSIGCSIYPVLARNVTELLNQADTALYSVKRTTRNGVAIFNPESPELQDPEEELHRVHAQLETASSDFRAVFAHARDPMMITDDEARIINVNDATARFTGLTRERMLGTPLLEFIQPEQTEDFLRLINETLERGIASGHFDVSLPDGRRPTVEYSTSRVGPDRYLTVIRDVTKREKNARALAQSEAGFRALFDHALDAIIITDDDGIVRGANHAACQLIGRSLPELIGSKGEDLVDAGAAPEVSAARDTMTKDQAVLGTMRLKDADGRWREVEFTAVADFVPGRHMSIIREITDREHRLANGNGNQS